MYASQQLSNQYQPGIPNAKYKTMLCRHFLATGQCAIGGKCQFAHGQQEMRQITDPLPQVLIQQVLTTPVPQQQTYQDLMKQQIPQPFKIPCKYHALNYCKNGANCQYSHDGDNQMVDFRLEPSKEDPLTTVLFLILQTMEQIFPQEDITQKLKIAQDQVRGGNLTVGCETIKQIVQDPERTKEEIEQYGIMYNNAVQYYNQLLN